MRLKVYSVFDDKAGAFARPFFLQNDALAIRSFSDAIADKSTGLSIHASDYKLYNLGEFDDVSGELIRVKLPVFLCNAVDFMPPIDPAKEVEDEKNTK